MQILATRVLGHTVTAMLTLDGWEVEIDAHIPVMERDFYLRSTYVSPQVSVALNAAEWDILEAESDYAL